MKNKLKYLFISFMICLSSFQLVLAEQYKPVNETEWSAFDMSYKQNLLNAKYPGYATLFIFTNYIPNCFLLSCETEFENTKFSRIFLENLKTKKIKFVGISDMRDKYGLSRFAIKPGSYKIIAINWNHHDKLQKVTSNLNVNSNQNFYFHLLLDNKSNRLNLSQIDIKDASRYIKDVYNQCMNYIGNKFAGYIPCYNKNPKKYTFSSISHLPTIMHRSSKTKLNQFRFLQCQVPFPFASDSQINSNEKKASAKILQCNYNFLPKLALTEGFLSKQKPNSNDCPRQLLFLSEQKKVLCLFTN